mgnify:FL=1
MDYEFSSLEELYKRVRPALKSKVDELQKYGNLSISEYDLWKCLVINKWRCGTGLMLSDIVDDILNTSFDEINSYYMKMINDEEIL